MPYVNKSRKMIKLQSYVLRDAPQFRGCRRFEADQRTNSPSGVSSRPYPSSTDWIELSRAAEGSLNNVSGFIAEGQRVRERCTPRSERVSSGKRRTSRERSSFSPRSRPTLTRSDKSDNPCSITWGIQGKVQRNEVSKCENLPLIPLFCCLWPSAFR